MLAAESTQKTGVYGIYICSDDARSRRCSGKKAADFNKIFNFQGLQEAKNAVFYYQFAVIGLDYATVYNGTPNNVGTAREQLAAKKPRKDLSSQLEKAAGLMRGVKSLSPTTFVADKVMTLQLELAMIDPSGACR